MNKHDSTHQLFVQLIFVASFRWHLLQFTLQLLQVLQLFLAMLLKTNTVVTAFITTTELAWKLEILITAHLAFCKSRWQDKDPYWYPYLLPARFETQSGTAVWHVVIRDMVVAYEKRIRGYA